MTQFSTHARNAIGSLLAILITMSLFWCGDTDCLSESSDDQCASLICSLFSASSEAGQTEGCDGSTDCTCVCHTLTISAPIIAIDYHPPVFYGKTDPVPSVPLTPTQLIYHPPLAA